MRCSRAFRRLFGEIKRCVSKIFTSFITFDYFAQEIQKNFFEFIFFTQIGAQNTFLTQILNSLQRRVIKKIDNEISGDKSLICKLFSHRILIEKRGWSVNQRRKKEGKVNHDAYNLKAFPSSSAQIPGFKYWIKFEITTSELRAVEDLALLLISIQPNDFSD